MNAKKNVESIGYLEIMRKRQDEEITQAMENFIYEIQKQVEYETMRKNLMPSQPQEKGQQIEDKTLQLTSELLKKVFNQCEDYAKASIEILFALSTNKLSIMTLDLKKIMVSIKYFMSKGQNGKMSERLKPYISRKLNLMNMTANYQEYYEELKTEKAKKKIKEEGFISTESDFLSDSSIPEYKNPKFQKSVEKKVEYSYKQKQYIKQLEKELHEQKERIINREEVLADLTQGYLKDLSHLKEIIGRNSKDMDECFQVNYFDPSVIFDQKTREILNSRLQDIRYQYECKSSNILTKLKQTQIQYERVSAYSYLFIFHLDYFEQLYSSYLGVTKSNDTASLLKQIFQLEPNPYKLWRLIQDTVGNSYFFWIFDNPRAGYGIDYQEINQFLGYNKSYDRQCEDLKKSLRAKFQDLVLQLQQEVAQIRNEYSEKERQLENTERIYADSILDAKKIFNKSTSSTKSGEGLCEQFCKGIFQSKKINQEINGPEKECLNPQDEAIEIIGKQMGRIAVELHQQREYNASLKEQVREYKLKNNMYQETISQMAQREVKQEEPVEIPSRIRTKTISKYSQSENTNKKEEEPKVPFEKVQEPKAALGWAQEQSGAVQKLMTSTQINKTTITKIQGVKEPLSYLEDEQKKIENLLTPLAIDRPNLIFTGGMFSLVLKGVHVNKETQTDFEDFPNVKILKRRMNEDVVIIKNQQSDDEKIPKKHKVRISFQKHKVESGSDDEKEMNPNSVWNRLFNDQFGRQQREQELRNKLEGIEEGNWQEILKILNRYSKPKIQNPNVKRNGILNLQSSSNQLEDINSLGLSPFQQESLQKPKVDPLQVTSINCTSGAQNSPNQSSKPKSRAEYYFKKTPSDLLTNTNGFTNYSSRDISSMDYTKTAYSNPSSGSLTFDKMAEIFFKQSKESKGNGLVLDTSATATKYSKFDESNGFRTFKEKESKTYQIQNGGNFKRKSFSAIRQRTKLTHDILEDFNERGISSAMNQSTKMDQKNLQSQNSKRFKYLINC